LRNILRCCTRWCAHPVTGKQALFVNEGFTTRIVDVTEKESEALLASCSRISPEFQVRWRWQENDLAIWDNRVTQHYANADYLPQRRIMQRATILGISRFTVRLDPRVTA
jgi:taurine dioxygenase